MSTAYGPDPLERERIRQDNRDNAPALRAQQAPERDTGLDRDTVVPADRDTVVAAERERYGGTKIGSAFFGWLTATGIAVLLTALVAAAGAAVAVAKNSGVGPLTRQATQNVQTVGLVGTVVLLVILFVAYYCGGYVAGRMARFDGAKQGVAVWLWAVLVAVIIALVAAFGGTKYNVLAQLNSLPRIPVNEGTLTTGSIIALGAVAVISLAGAILGGLAGMWFHRQVDKTGLDVLEARVT